MQDSFTSTVLPATDIAHWNVHALEHYLSHPDVHVPVLRLLTGYADMISADEHTQALAEWRRTRIVTLHKAEQQALEGLAARTSSRFEDEIDVLLKFRRRVLEEPLLDGESGGSHD
jgi:hypothetical protein